MRKAAPHDRLHRSEARAWRACERQHRMTDCTAAKQGPGEHAKGSTDMTAEIGVVVPTLEAAGAERVARTLAARFTATARVTMVTFDPRLGRRELARAGHLPWADRVPDGCAHVPLPATGSGVTRLGVLAVRFAALARQRRFD